MDAPVPSRRNLGAFVRGNMFAGLLGPDVGVRRATPDVAAAWAGRAHGYVAALPPKQKKAAREKPGPPA